MNLGSVLRAVCCKRLAAVEIDPARSNQHELNATVHLQAFFGTDDLRQAPIDWFQLSDQHEPLTDRGQVSYYDSRAAHPTRTEWRVYYTGRPFAHADPGDHLMLLRTMDDRFVGLVAAGGSTWQREIEMLLGIDLGGDGAYQLLHGGTLELARVGPRQQQLLELLGVDLDMVPAAASDEDIVVEAFGQNDAWPSTRAVIQLAQAHADVIDDDPDAQLLAWLEREERLFRALERVRVSERIRSGFVGSNGTVDVDGFMRVSLSIHNRRKSRMGKSLEGHLAELFRRAGLRFAEQARTEGRRVPDFVFPGAEEYQEYPGGDERLATLAAKSTCKDRWRQILNEAAKVPLKHLCTLEPAISANQLIEMREENVALVIPSRDHAAFTPEQRRALLTVSDFIDERRAAERLLG